MASNLAGKVQTVTGPIEPERLGVTLTHEHLLIDISVVRRLPESATAKDFFFQPVTQETVGRIRHYAAPNQDNARLFDVPTAIDEVMLYKQHGGASLVDATSIGLARDPVGLFRISNATGVNVIMGASYYVGAAHPPEMDQLTEEDIVQQIVRDVMEGADDTSIKSGIIGEIGCSWPLEDNERKVLRASAKAQRFTGAPLLIHPGRNEAAPAQIIEVLEGAGADLDRTIISHLDRTVFLKETLTQIAVTGCYMEWDLFGNESSYYPPNPSIDMPSDAKRIDDIAWISSQGYGDKVVIAQDICAKHRLVKYGGHGYHYILGHVVPRMRARGLSSEAIDKILVDNPRDALTFVAPEA